MINNFNKQTLILIATFFCVIATLTSLYIIKDIFFLIPVPFIIYITIILLFNENNSGKLQVIRRVHFLIYFAYINLIYFSFIYNRLAVLIELPLLKINSPNLSNYITILIAGIVICLLMDYIFISNFRISQLSIGSMSFRIDSFEKNYAENKQLTESIIINKEITQSYIINNTPNAFFVELINQKYAIKEEIYNNVLNHYNSNRGNKFDLKSIFIDNNTGLDENGIIKKPLLVELDNKEWEQLLANKYYWKSCNLTNILYIFIKIQNRNPLIVKLNGQIRLLERFVIKDLIVFLENQVWINLFL